jgi:hypothetical protein
MARDIALFSIGLLPFILIAVAFLSMVPVLLFAKLTADDITEILIAMGCIWLMVISIMLFISHVCVRITPTELFDGSMAPFLDTITETEDKVCALIKESDEFIRSDVGPSGEETPSLVLAAQNKARGDTPMTMCPPLPLRSDDPAVIEDRLTRMERTLADFTGVQLKKTYSATKSECFAGQKATIVEWKSRLQTIQDTLNAQTSQYLAPIQQKQQELRSGQASDCDKQRGAENSASMTELTAM